jgi:hypothetical protein
MTAIVRCSLFRVATLFPKIPGYYAQWLSAMTLGFESRRSEKLSQNVKSGPLCHLLHLAAKITDVFGNLVGFPGHEFLRYSIPALKHWRLTWPLHPVRC